MVFLLLLPVYLGRHMHTTTPCYVGGDVTLTNFLPGLALNHNPPYRYSLSSWDYRLNHRAWFTVIY
jgi:hypothetical protein